MRAQSYESLTPRQQCIIDVASFCASDQQTRLVETINTALECKAMTVNEIKDELVQLYCYCGFPRAITALGTLMQTVTQRKEQGLPCEDGREATPADPNVNFRELGTQVQTDLFAGPVKGAFFDFCPSIDHCLKAHLFGYIFQSDLLTHQERELATIAALASLPAPIQLVSHYQASFNTGGTESKLQEFASYVGEHVTAEAGDVASSVLSQVLAQRQKA